MSRFLQAGLATLLAAGAHVGIFAALPGGEGAAALQAAGEEGRAEISLAPAPEELASLIASWETPPAVADEPATPAPAAQEPAPSLPEATRPEVFSAPPVAPVQPEAEAAPASVSPPAPAEKAPVKETAKDAPAKPAAAPSKPAEKPAQKAEKKAASALSTGQKAKGKGKGAVSGTGGSDQANAPGSGQVKKLQTEWGAKIRSRIAKSLRRPAKQVGGTVVLSLVVGPDGSLRSARITQSSGDAAQDQAALAAVKSAGRFPKAPEGVPETSIKVKLKFDK